jgi:hypothetical protein
MNTIDATPWTGGDSVGQFEHTETYQTYKNRMQSGNDFIICIAPSSQTAGSGTGKTTMAIQLARAFDDTDTGFDAETQATLSSQRVADDLYPNLPEGSSILWDESQGTQQSQGADARRSMSDEVLRVSRAAAIHRWKRIPLVIVTQSTKWMDSRMMDIIDRLILIVDVDYNAEYARAVVFKHYYDDLPQKGTPGEYTPAIEDIVWRPIQKTDPDYQLLHTMKQDSGTKGSSGDSDDNPDDGLMGWDPWVIHAAELHEHNGLSYHDIEKQPSIDYGHEWIRQKVNEFLESDASEELLGGAE